MTRSTYTLPVTAGMVGWDGVFPTGQRPVGIHPLASIGGPPEHRGWNVGDPVLDPEIDASALIHAFCTVDAGVTGTDPLGRERRPTTIGPRTFLQARVHVGHNAVIGADCEICAGVVVCGEVIIGDGVTVAGNSWIKPLVEIGDGAIIGGGSVVTKDVPPHEVWAGNPARHLKPALTHPGYQEWDRQRRQREGTALAKAQYDLTEEQWSRTYSDALWEHMKPWHHRHGEEQGR